MHSLTFDPNTREGSAIVALFNKLKTNGGAETDGPWNPGETTDTLLDWLTAQGIDVHDGLITADSPSGMASPVPNAEVSS